jgi:hypothetical protein
VTLAILVGLAVLPVIMPASRIISGMRGASPASDFALLELSTGEALRGAQLLGPYSRFGWRHPGPAYVYLQAPLCSEPCRGTTPTNLSKDGAKP